MIEKWLVAGGLLLLAGKSAQAAPVLPAGFTTQYDPLFQRHCRGIPVEFMRALAKRESNFNPNDTQGPAWGLMQVVEVVRRDFFKKTGRAAARSDLLDPGLNVEIACGTLSRIIKNYQKHHPRTLSMNWNSRRWIELLVAGWNAGYSEAAGVGYVVGVMESQGLGAPEITAASVQAQAARLSRASRFLAMPHRLTWWRSVADAYIAQTGQA